MSKFLALKTIRSELNFELEKRLIRAILEKRIPMVEFGLLICTPDENENFLELNRKRGLEIKKLVKEENRKVSSNQRTKIRFDIFTNILLPGTFDYEKNRNNIAFSYEEYPELANFETSVINGNNLKYIEMFAAKEKLSETLNGRENIDAFKTTGQYLYQYP
jgi:hypothetical protein